MPAEQSAQEPGPAEFDRIVTRLCADDPRFADPEPAAAKAAPRNPTEAGGGALVAGSLTVIVVTSLIIGGLLGLLGVATTSMVLAWMFRQEEADRSRQEGVRGPGRREDGR